MPFVEIISRPQGWVLEAVTRFASGPLGNGVDLEERDGGFHAHDWRPHVFLRLNGAQPIAWTRRLVHRDVLEVQPGRSLRFFEREEPAPASFIELERAIAEAPGDDMCWNVWADALAERGDERATLVRQLRREDDEMRARRLGSLAPLCADGHLALEWQRGHVRAATVRTYALTAATPVAWCLAQLLAHEAFAFLEQVHLDTLENGAESLRAAWPRSLQSVSFGPSRTAAGPEVLESLEALRGRSPRLATTATELVHTFRRATLRGPDTSFELQSPRTRLPGRSDVFLDLEDDGVWITGGSLPMMLNGRPFARARLLGGDVVTTGSTWWKLEYAP